MCVVHGCRGVCACVVLGGVVCVCCSWEGVCFFGLGRRGVCVVLEWEGEGRNVISPKRAGPASSNHNTKKNPPVMAHVSHS